MSKPSSRLFGGTIGAGSYNSANSSSVRKVDTVNTVNNPHSVPMKGQQPNSVTRIFRDGKLTSERYYDSDGNAYLDIDYTDHGNPKTHPDVPHEHNIHFDENGKPIRDEPPEGGINK